MIDFFYDSSFLILKFFILGILLGLIYDIFRLFRIGRNDKKYDPKTELKKRFFHQKKTQKQKNISDSLYIFAEDILFFFISACLQILMIYPICNFVRFMMRHYPTLHPKALSDRKCLPAT